jgi:4-alpha-glucanotransferase
MLKFQIHYHTTCEQQVCLCGSTSALGNFEESKALVLSNDDDRWFAEIAIENTSEIEYYYFIREQNATVCREWGSYRKLFVENKKTFHVHDLWKNKPYHTYLYSSLFTESICAHEKTSSHQPYFSHSILLNVVCPYVRKEQMLVISGNCNTLGDWDLTQAVPLSYANDGEWQILLNATDIPNETQYKFVIINRETREAVHWEDGGNRILFTEKVQKENSVFVEMGLEFHYRNFAFKGSGTAIPVFSLRTNESFGIGDFADLRKMVDWASLINQQLIQILPVNDTTTTKTWRDSYPYSAISIYALHPIYLGCLDFPLKNKQKQHFYIEEAKHLNSFSEIDYEKVLRLKNGYARALYLQDGATVLSSSAYKSFYKKNESWLFPYACFCFLRDKNQTAHFTDWGEFKVFDEGRLQRMLEREPEAKQEVDFHSFLQFLLHKQFSEIKTYAHKKGVSLKGDIPIGINHDSLDVWTAPHLFNLDTQTGAPPDDFSISGQNWGFPTYNWQAMEAENYAWWKNRFCKMTDYFDAYRIDHILGFFRIWEIPFDAVQGLLGYFSPALPYWAEEIENSGISFDSGRLTKPFIHEDFLPELFGVYTDEVKTTYLSKLNDKQFKLNLFCNAQQKIKHLFEGKTDEKNVQIYNGLLTLCTEVLFIRDKYDPNRFHPRITAQNTYSFRYLDEQTQQNFNHLYTHFFYHRHNYFWHEQAMKKLPALISSTSMLVCGEDLGMIPDCVPAVMNELQILSLEIERMPKNPQTQFTDLHRLPYLSVCTTSTHDMSPIRLWWTENRELTQRYYNEVLHHEGKAPAECCVELCREILENHLNSPAMWVILPWQDWLSIDERLRNPNIETERINIPANPEHYWQWRMHISLEELLVENELNEKVRKMSKR